MKKFPLALFVALVACAVYAPLSLFLRVAYGLDPGIIGRLIFTGMLCTLLTTSAFTAGESYSKKEALILALVIGFSIDVFYRSYIVIQSLKDTELGIRIFLGFLLSPKWWMWNIWVFPFAYFVLRKGFSRRITQDNFFNS